LTCFAFPFDFSFATIFHSPADGTPTAIIKSEAITYSNNNNSSSMMGMDYQSLQQQLVTSLAPTPQLLNPIDRLYSMQSQYFCNNNNNNTSSSESTSSNGIHVHHHQQHQHHQMCE